MIADKPTGKGYCETCGEELNRIQLLHCAPKNGLGMGVNGNVQRCIALQLTHNIRYYAQTVKASWVQGSTLVSV